MGALVGKVAIVTGAASGIGAATARRMAAEGASVGLVDIRMDVAAGVAERITADGGSAMAVGADVRLPPPARRTTRTSGSPTPERCATPASSRC